MPWTVVAIAMGGGADGEGETPPLSPSLKEACNPRPRGRGQSWRYPMESRAPDCNQSGTPGWDLNNVIIGCFVGHYPFFAGDDGGGRTPLDLPERLVSPAIILKGSCPAVGAMKKGK